MQNRSFQNLPIVYRPYDFPAAFPVLAFIGDYWRNTGAAPEFLHFHNGLEIARCLDDSGQVCCGALGSFPCRSGDYCIIFPQIPHITVNGSDANSWEYLYVEPKLFLGGQEGFSDTLWQVFYLPRRAPVVVGRQAQPLLHLYISGIFREFHEKKAFYRRAVHGLMTAFLAEMNRTAMRFCEADCPGEEAASAYASIRAALGYIYEHYAENISIGQLAAYCCVSESHFRRIFKKTVGVSPLEYIQHYRIQQACQLIYLNRDPLSLIARKVGYRSLSSFNRQFQQYMHCAPTSYRREHLMQPLRNEVLSYEDTATRHIFKI